MKIPDSAPPAPGDIEVTCAAQPGPLGWLRRVTVRVDGNDIGKLEPGQTRQWRVNAGGHVVRVYDTWGRSADCQITVAPRVGHGPDRPNRGPTHLHCRINTKRTAVIKVLAPLWLIARWLPGFAWSLHHQPQPAPSLATT